MGLLLAVAATLLIFFSWSRLGGEKARINLDRYADWSATNSRVLLLTSRVRGSMAR